MFSDLAGGIKHARHNFIVSWDVEGSRAGARIKFCKQNMSTSLLCDDAILWRSLDLC